MWVTLLSITYDDFKLEQSDITIYRNMAMQFFQDFANHNLTILKSEICCEIPDTQDQAKLDRWHSERKFRITGSICKNVVNLSENLSEHHSLRPYFNWLEKIFWLFPTHFSNFYTKYGTENEVTGLREYIEHIQVSVGLSGLWINKKYLHLAGSPDGLVFGGDKNLLSIVEVKCLNILKLHSVNDIINGDCQSVEVKRQCFVVEDKKLVLKRTHSYFYQIQLQLLVTEARFCDFVLHSAKGPVSIEGIYSDSKLQTRIVESTRSF